MTFNCVIFFKNITFFDCNLDAPKNIILKNHQGTKGWLCFDFSEFPSLRLQSARFVYDFFAKVGGPPNP